MSDFYGYNPAEYMKDYSYINRAGAAIGAGAIKLGEYNEEQKKAIETAKKNKNYLDYAYKANKRTLEESSKPLLEANLLTQDRYNAMVSSLISPDKFDTPDGINVEGFISANKDAVEKATKYLDTLYDKLEQLKTDTGIKQTIEGGAQQPAIGFQNPETEALSGDLGASMADLTKASEATQAIGQQQPAKLPTKGEAGWDLAGKYTKGEAEGSLAYGSLKSEADIAKEAQAKDKADLAAQNLEIRKRRMDMDKNREDRLTKNDAVARARLALDREKFEYVQSSQVGKELDNKLKLFVNSDVAVAEAEGTIEEMENKIEDLKVRAGSREAKFDSAVAEQIEKEIGEITGKMAGERKSLRSLIDKSIKHEGEYDKATLTYDRFVESEINKEGPVSKYTKSKVGIGGPKETAPAPSPSGSGTPAPVIGGASPKLPPKDTAIAGTLPGSIKKPQTKAELIDWLKNVKKMPPDAIERYVAMQNQKGLFLK